MDKLKVNGHIYECFEDLNNNNQFYLRTGDLQGVIDDFKNTSGIVRLNSIGQVLHTVTGVVSVSSVSILNNYYIDDDGVAQPVVKVDLVVADINQRVAILEDKLNDDINEAMMSLEEYKAYKIAQSKQALADYLESHPIKTTVHNGKEGTYSITKEKQDLLTQNYMSYQLAKVLDPDNAVLTWNESGDVCEPWTEEEFVQLLLMVKSIVAVLVSYQQYTEKLITQATGKAEVAKIEFDFDKANEWYTEAHSTKNEETNEEVNSEEADSASEE